MLPLDRLRKYFFVILCSIHLVSCSQQYQKQLDLIQATTTYPAQFKSEIPVKEYCLVFRVKANINGKVYNFVINTENDMSVLSTKTAKELGLPLTKVLVSIKDFQLENIQFPNSYFEVNNEMKNIPTCCDEEIHGIIGTNILSKAIWQFDYPNNRLFVASHLDSLKMPKIKYTIPFNTEHQNFGKPIVKLHLNKNYLTDVTIATGYNSGLYVPEKVFNALEDTAKYMLYYNVRYDEANILAKKATKKEIVVNRLSVDDILPLDSISLFKTHYDIGSVGNYMLKNYVVIFDWKSKKITFSDKKNTEKTNSKTPGFFYHYHPKLKKIIVHTVIKNSPADNAGIEVGDEIISAGDDDDFTKMNLSSFIEWSKQLAISNKKIDYYRIKKDNSVEQIYLRTVEYSTLWRIKKSDR